MPELIDAEGNFTQDFQTALPTLLGDEHKDSVGMFKDVGNIGTLVKAYAGSKVAMSKRLENVIQKLDAKADDKAKAEYAATLRKELGIELPESPDKYNLFRPQNLPEGMVFADDILKDVAALAYKHSVGNAFMKEASQLISERQIKRYTEQLTTYQQAEQKAFEEAENSIKTDWPGDNLPKNTRIALLALNEFAADDLKKTLKDEKLYDNATDLSVWRKIGIWPRDLRIWHNIGLKTLPASVLKGETGGATPPKISDELKKRSADYPPAQFKDLYNEEELKLLGVV